MEKKENTGTKLNVLLCNLVDYVRGDDRPLVFAVMQEITEYFEQELDKAREEKIQNIFTREEWGLMYESLIYRFGNDKGFKHLEQKILGMRKLSKLKDNK